MLQNPMSISRSARRGFTSALITNAPLGILSRSCRNRKCIRHASHIVYHSPTATNSHRIKEGVSSIPPTAADGTSSISAHSTTLLPHFHDPESAHGSKTYWELVRAILVLNLCRVNFLVEHGSKIIDWSYRILGDSITNAVLQPLFFQQFCAGEDFKETTDSLKKHGIQSILDYCAESDGTSTVSSIDQRQQPNQPARTYKYYSEAQCDHHRDNFLNCLKSVRDVQMDGKGGFMALKVTALGNPHLLERVSPIILKLRELVASGKHCRELLETSEDSPLRDLIYKFDPNNTGLVDFISWAKLWSPSDILWLSRSSRDVGVTNLNLSSLSEQEIQLVSDIQSRALAIAEEASNHGTKLLFDAEQTWVQPAIDNLVLGLQTTFNDTKQTRSPIIFHTYQCYLKDALRQIEVDVERSQRLGYHFGAKLVRGAYIESERKRAVGLKYNSPVHDTLHNTHTCYNNAMNLLLSYQPTQHISAPSKIEVMIATHNEISVQNAIQYMGENRIPKDKVHFAQLLGMSDNLSFPLGKQNYSVFKYVPYGKVKEAIPYLLRRAVENRDVIKNNAIGLR
mmetsp:Transcript_8338/g.12130  ORF Transcript_8338/g.12130 Transcript_8338/m.12130 type:complete len:567 (-) Transcript_8338:776-2476(-)